MKKWVISLLCFVFSPVNSGTNPYIAGSTGSSLACTRLITQNTDTSSAIQNTDILAQKLKITSSIVVCQVQIYAYEEDAGAVSATIEFWDAATGGNQIGTTSSTIDFGSGGSAAWYAVTWEANPTLTGDCFMRLVSGGSTAIKWKASASDVYEIGNNYDAYRGGSEVGTNLDFSMKIDTMQ